MTEMIKFLAVPVKRRSDPKSVTTNATASHVHVKHRQDP